MGSRRQPAYRLAMVIAAGVFAASCQSSSSGSSASPAPATPRQAPPTNLASDEALYHGLAGNSILGFTTSGAPTCEYYRADGEVTVSNAGRDATGSWTVEGSQACQQLDGPPVCKQFSFNPDGSVSSWIVGSNTPAFGEVVTGNRCTT